MKKVFTLILSFALIGISFVAEAQSFFKPLKKPTLVNHSKGFATPNVAPAPGEVTEMNAVRPVTNIAAFAEPGHYLAAGAGISYEHLKYSVADDRWKSTWSISALTWVGAGLGNSDDKPSAVTYGITAGFFNNLIMIGPAINNGKVIAMIGLGININ